MALMTVKCYYETGLTPNNCLDSISKLDTLGFTSRAYESIWTLQDKEKQQIKIGTTYENIQNVDYCIINNVGYWVTSVTMLNENNASLTLSADYLTTVGIGNITVISGWCTRKCVTDDTLFSNDIAEPFTPKSELVIDYGNVIKPSTVADIDYQIIVSTVDLLTVGETAKTYTDENTQLSVAVPQVPQATENTLFTIPNISKGYYLPNAGCYNTRKANVLEGLTAVRSLGVDNCLVDSYSVPQEYVGRGSSTADRYGELGGINENIDSTLNPVYATVKNKKALSGQFQQYVLLSVVSGDMQQFPVEQIINNNKVTWKLMSDLLPDGRPLARPAYYYSHSNDYWLATVRGEQWQKNPLAYTGNSGQMISDIAFDRQMNLSNLKTAVGYGSPASLSNPFLPLAIASDIGSVRDKTIQHFTERNIISPEIKFARTSSMQNYVGNYFYDMRYRLSDSDLIRFDNFLTQFGYAVFEPLDNSAFTGRTHFNYVEADSVNISVPFPYSYRIGCINQLESGVRIWHDKPSSASMIDNPIA